MTTTTKPISLAALAKLEGLITPDVGEHLHLLAASIPTDQAIVEIGAWKGKSTCYLAAGRAAGEGGRVFSVDPWTTDVNDWSRYHKSASLKDWKAQIRRAGFSTVVTPLQGKSVDVAPTWDHGLIGFLYIDGDHAGVEVRNDWEAWRGYLAPKAMVVFDDYGVSHNPEVAPMVHEIVNSGDLSLIEIAANGRIAVCQVGAE